MRAEGITITASILTGQRRGFPCCSVAAHLGRLGGRIRRAERFHGREGLAGGLRREAVMGPRPAQDVYRTPGSLGTPVIPLAAPCSFGNWSPTWTTQLEIRA